jgi:hypothetical protein
MIASRAMARHSSACQLEGLQAAAVQLDSCAPLRALEVMHMHLPTCAYIVVCCIDSTDILQSCGLAPRFPTDA